MTFGTRVSLACAALAALTEVTFEAPRQDAATREDSGRSLEVPGAPSPFALANPFAYIPPQCWTETRGQEGAPASNPCYVCHTRGTPPNDVDDEALQRTLTLPAAVANNPWTNVLDPPVERHRRDSDDEILAYVRGNNYSGSDGAPLALAGSGHPLDAWFSFDAMGFDRRPDGTFTGWRAFAYSPFLGTFFPTNGAMDDVLIRLDTAFREDESGRFDRAIYVINLAIVEALVKRVDVALDPVDEEALHVDLDGDGTLGRATRVAFGPHMQYVGRARVELASGRLSLSPGLLPPQTEFLHSVRYLDVGPDGRVTMAPRMKELRYAEKVRWLSPSELSRIAAREDAEQSVSPGRIEHFVPQSGRGVYNGKGWLLQGYIEDSRGQLRPQTYEETVACVGCHGGIGATTDSTFSLPRKLSSSEFARGWYHWTQHPLAGTPEPRGRDGAYEYTRYLTENRAGDEFRENAEVTERFFDSQGTLRPEAVTRLHGDVGLLLVPSSARALALDRAYRAIVLEQSFARGRDVVLGPPSHIYARAPIGEPTGIEPSVAPHSPGRGRRGTPPLEPLP